MKNFALAFIAALLLLNLFLPAGCIKPPDYPNEPVITYEGMSKNTMRQSAQPGTDSIIVFLSFTDGDGDLGSNDTTVDVFVVDSRDNTTDVFRLPYIEPQGAGNGISGDIALRLPSTCCIYMTPEGQKFACTNLPPSLVTDTLHYLIRIKDRSGHLSNQVSTERITLNCQ